jgi:uncharacterized protein (DUF4415 family)
MTNSAGTKKYSMAEIEAMAGKVLTITDPPRAEEDLPERFWTEGVRRHRGASQTLVQVPIDDEVLAWFRQQSAEHQALMTAALRQFAVARGAKV